MSKKLYFSISFVLVLNLASIACSAPSMIRMDFDKSDYVRTEPGFTSFTLSENGKEVNEIAIDVTGNINDCRRSDPNSVESGIDIYTEQVYRDMVYGTSPSGVTITLWGLGVNQQCDISIYAFDNNSTPNRLADWYGNGTYLFTTDFEGGDIYQWPSPWWGIDYVFGPNTATADEYGRIILTSTRNAASPEGKDFAFVNGLVAAPKGTYIPPVYAQHPMPFDDAEGVPADTNLSWKKSTYAEKHDVYFSTEVAKVIDANRSTPLGVLVSENQSTTTYDPPGDLGLGTTYYWRIDEVNETPSLVITKGEVWSFTTRESVLIASNPAPLDSARGVYPDVNLSWQKGEYSEKHDVYLGTDGAKVTDANRSNPLGVLVSQDHSTTTYGPAGTLNSDTTYYWRIDEVNAAPDYTIFKGEVWSFTTSYAPPSQTIDPPYEVGTWRGFRPAATTYTFDDCTTNQIPVAIPIFNEFGYKSTLFVVTNWVTGNNRWPDLQGAASAGHEVASHTASHYPLGGSTDIDIQRMELESSQSVINSHITGQRCLTLAYPGGSSGNPGLLASEYYMAARGGGGIEESTPPSFYYIRAVACGSEGDIQTPEDFNSILEYTATLGGWVVFCIHGIDNDEGYSPLSSTTLRSSLEYLDARRDVFWVENFGNVVRYIRERNYVSVTESSNDGNSITLQVTDTLGDANYNYPLTIRRPLPAGWPTIDITQDGQTINASIAEVNSMPYVMFDVMPDGGDIVLAKGYGDFTNDGIVDMNDLSVFHDFWLVNDCNETADMDLNGDCLVNFYEFAGMAKNWLLRGPE